MFNYIKNNTYRLLRWSERYTKTDMIYLASGGFWLVLGYLGQLIVSLMIVIILTNTLSKSDYGIYQFILTWAAILSVFTLSGLPTALTKYVARGDTGLLQYAFKKHLIWSLLTLGTSSLLSIYYLMNGNYILGFSFVVMAIVLPLLNGFDLSKSFLNGKKDFKTKTTVDLFTKSIPVLSIILTLFFTQNVLIIICVFFISNTLISGIFYWLVRKKYVEKVQRNEKLTLYGLHLSLMNSFSIISKHADKLLVWYFLGPISMAVYTLSMIPIGHLQSLLSLVRSLALPKFTERSLVELRKVLPSKIKIFFFFAFFIAIIYISAAPFIFNFLFPKYPEAILYSQVLAILILATPRTLVGQVFIAHEMKKQQYILSFSVAFFRIVLLLTLLPFFGIWGAIIALLITAFFSTGLQWLLFYSKN